MSETEKIFEGSTVVVKATVLQEHTDKLKSVTFKFFQDGKEAKADELSEGSEFEKKYTADDVGNGSEEDEIEGYDVIVHKVAAPACAKDQESYILDYHLFYEIEDANGKIVKNQDLSVKKFMVLPKTGQLKATWAEGGEAFENFRFKVMQNGEQVGPDLHTFQHDTTNVNGDKIPAGSAEFNLGLCPGFKIVPIAPWEIVETVANDKDKRKVEIKGDLKFKAAFLSPQKGERKQYVNFAPENFGHEGIGNEVILDLGIDPEDPAAQSAGNQTMELHFRATFGPEKGKAVEKSSRNDKDNPTKVEKANKSDKATITEKKANAEYEGKIELKNGNGQLKLLLGLAGGDTCFIEISGSDKFLTDKSIQPDQTLKLENWRKVFYELMVPDSLEETALDSSSMDLRMEAAQRLETMGRKLFIEFEHDFTHIFRTALHADHGTVGTKQFFNIAGDESKPSYVLSGRNWRKLPLEQMWGERHAGQTLYISLCDRILKWRDDTKDEKAGTKDYSGTLNEAEGFLNVQETFGGLFMPFSGHDGGDCITEIQWTADISKDDSECKYTPEMTVKEDRYEGDPTKTLYVELEHAEHPETYAELAFELKDDKYQGDLNDGHTAVIQSFINKMLADKKQLVEDDCKLTVLIEGPQDSGKDEDKCFNNTKSKLDELFKSSKEEFAYHPGLDPNNDNAPRSGSCSMAEFTDIGKSNVNEWHYSLPMYLGNYEPGPGKFVGAAKTKDTCPIKFELSFQPHEQSNGESDGKLIAWACTDNEANKFLARLVIESFSTIEDEAGPKNVKPEDCFGKDGTLSDKGIDFGRAVNLCAI